ncbi:MAG: two component transcriptional regulator, LytTR family, partial [Firmicutes bacterium]|nr:two component transcriptional regulator, LytTR family [Bacillota bacterium]
SVVAGTHDRRLLLSLNQICAARVDGGHVLLVTETGELPTPYESLGELQKRLPEGAFFQVDRGCLVNLAKVREVHPLFNRTVQLVLADRQGTKIPVSRRRTGLLRELLQF